MINTELRKKRSEESLKISGIPINPHLPVIESEDEITLRSPEDIAKRAIALLAVAVRGEGLEQQEAIDILTERKVWESTTPKERAFLLNKNPTEQERINFTWRYEGLWVLLWALGHIEELGMPTSICDVPHAVRIVLDIPAETFIGQAKSRSKSEILDETDFIYRYHWAVVDARLKGNETPGNLDPGVVYERHYTLNWLIGYLDQEWDDISTDT